MSIASMTGFARAAGQNDTHRWIWEAKSVNGRTLDVRLRLPPGYERLEVNARQMAAEKLARGSVSLTLSVETHGSDVELRVNRELLNRLFDLHEELAGRVASDPPRLETLLTVRGVVESGVAVESEEETTSREKAVLASLVEVLDSLADSRRAEGDRLKEILVGHLAMLEDLCGRAAACDAARITTIRDRLQSQLAELLEGAAGMSEDRLAQEVALLATKADVREEIDRLKSHCVSARQLFTEKAPIGRRLDFLCQEFNREANTLCSKSPSEELTRIGLDFKATIDQFREQAQNVE